MLTCRWLFVWLYCACQPAFNQIDLREQVKPVMPEAAATGLSVFDTNPESPDGKYLCFVSYPVVIRGGYEADPVKVDVMIRNRHTGTTKRLAGAKANNHNGVNALWVDSVTLAIQIDLSAFEIYDVVTEKRLYGPVKGELGHKSFGKNIYFSRCSGRSVKAGFSEYEEGIFVLNSRSGAIRKIVSKAEILTAFLHQNPSIYSSGIKVLHIEPSPDETKVFFDFRHNWPNDAKQRAELHGCVNANGTNIRWIRERPMHVVWYDNQTMMGIYMHDAEKKICQFDLEGHVLDTLGGTATHMGASPDRQWYVGESGFYQAEKDGFTRVYLYYKGDKKPVALLCEWKNSKVTWAWKAHVNPAFSADGKRIYFIRSYTDMDKYEAVYLDLPLELINNR